jgi:mono/diheme cytochrome c family protein
VKQLDADKRSLWRSSKPLVLSSSKDERRRSWFDKLTMSGVVCAALFTGCGTPPGRPHTESIALAPSEVVEFDALYADNCAGCHGAHGAGGPAIALANPVYLAIVDDRSMRATVADGVRGTSMPAFAQRAGGMLTEQQIDVLVNGLRSRWSRPAALAGANPPSYAPASAGDVHRGATVYQTFCQGCHGAEGQGGPKGSAITNDSFLALVSDQALRTMVIAGRPELGAPDWRGYVDGRPGARGFSRAMSDQEVTDVVSWLASHRVVAPGRPYAADRSVLGGLRVE